MSPLFVPEADAGAIGEEAMERRRNAAMALH